MLNKRHAPLAAALFPLSLASCASIMVGNTSTIEVTSNPEGAQVTSSTGLEAVTPCSFVLPNGVDVELTAVHIAHPGDTRTLVSMPDTSRWAAGNILFGGAAGLASDASNKGAKVHKHDVHFDFMVTVEEQERIAAEKEAARIEATRRSGGTTR